MKTAVNSITQTLLLRIPCSTDSAIVEAVYGHHVQEKENIMTRKDFEKYRMQIESDKLPNADSDPLTYGMQRAMFEKGKLTKLIAAAETVEGKTARAHAERWKRKLRRISSSQNNFQKLRNEFRNSKLDIFSLVRASQVGRQVQQG